MIAMSYQKQNSIGVTKQLVLLPLSAKALPCSHLRGILQEVLKSTPMVFLSLPGARLKLSLTSLSEETNFTLNGLKLRVLYQ